MATIHERRKGPNSMSAKLNEIETDKGHHLSGPFQPQTPLGSGTSTPVRTSSPAVDSLRNRARLWSDVVPMRWIIEPFEALKLLLVPVVLYLNWEMIAPYLGSGLSNPFYPLLFISHRVPGSPDDDPRYAKGYNDILFVLYYIIFWSFVRQAITINLCRPLARYFGLRKPGKLDRFGEQGYAVVYFAFFGAWGYRIMSQLPTYWYKTEHFWIGYPHWDMKQELKRYYLMQMAYWCQQLLVLLLGLEKPRKDYNELVAHHFVTLWLVGWSYLINLTVIGNAVYMSMDIPDSLIAFSKMMNYIQWNKTKTVTFIIFAVSWAYFRHWLNWRILWSVWYEFGLIPETSKRWYRPDGVWLTWWMQYQILFPIVMLQIINLFWFFLILRIAYRSVVTSVVDDERSDDEGDDEPVKED